MTRGAQERVEKLERALKKVRRWLRQMEFTGWANYITKELKQ